MLYYKKIKLLWRGALIFILSDSVRSDVFLSPSSVRGLGLVTFFRFWAWKLVPRQEGQFRNTTLFECPPWASLRGHGLGPFIFYWALWLCSEGPTATWSPLSSNLTPVSLTVSITTALYLWYMYSLSGKWWIWSIDTHNYNWLLEDWKIKWLGLGYRTTLNEILCDFINEKPIYAMGSTPIHHFTWPWRTKNTSFVWDGILLQKWNG